MSLYAMYVLLSKEEKQVHNVELVRTTECVMQRRCHTNHGRGQLKYNGTRAEIRFRFSAKRTSPFKSAGESVQSTTGSRGVRISVSNAG